MATTGAPKDLRDELASLHIDRSRGRTPRDGGSLRRWWLALAALVLVAAGAFAWRALGRPLEVQVVYAERSEPGAASASGPVLSGSGYVVTGDKYISIGVRVAGRIDAYLVDESDRVVKGQPLVR
jgi:multidrug efflux pump subunit AcrA (membrane-fusion protein)